MWVFFDGGFVSIVQFKGTDELLVRARVRTDLETFVKLTGHAMASKAITETPNNDYRFRMRIARVAVGRALAKIATAINYPNFKDQVKETQGQDRANIYHDVWADVLQLSHPRRVT